MSENKKKVCVRCRGASKDCPICKGVNIVKISCDMCNGKGMDSDRRLCDFCHGVGSFQGMLENKENVISHPKHYTFGTIEVIDVIEDWGLDKEFHLANVIKYIARAKHKGDELESYKKAQWYLNRKISNMELESAAGDDE